MINFSRYFSVRNIASFTLIFMSVQFLFVEGWAISIPKVAFMAITPILILAKTPYISKAVIFGSLFWVVTVGMSIVQFGLTSRMSTFYYSALFLLTFILYYNLVYINKVFGIEQFIGLIKIVIYAYAIVLILQQFFYLIGIRYMPLINLMNQPYYSLFRLNSLAIEPSHAGRLLAVYFYAFLKLIEYKEGSAPSIKMLWKDYRILIIAFLYTMIGIGSGTAFIALAILLLYFLKRQYVLLVICIAIAIYLLIPIINFEPLNRAVNIFHATMSGDVEIVTKTDNSAATRVNIILNTINNLDLTKSETWFGRGIDSNVNVENAVVSAINDYGLISYIFKLILFFSCCFNSLFSLEIIMFILLFSFNIGNIAYGWATLMIFSTIKYFKYNC